MRAGPARASFGVGHLLVLGMLAQATLAGLFLYSQPDLLRLHRILGMALVAVALVQLAATWAARFDPDLGLVPLAVAQLVLLAGQIWLGLAGRRTPIAAALHLPNAFLVFALAILWLARARRAIRGP